MHRFGHDKLGLRDTEQWAWRNQLDNPHVLGKPFDTDGLIFENVDVVVSDEPAGMLCYGHTKSDSNPEQAKLYQEMFKNYDARRSSEGHLQLHFFLKCSKFHNPSGRYHSGFEQNNAELKHFLLETLKLTLVDLDADNLVAGLMARMLEAQQASVSSHP